MIIFALSCPNHDESWPLSGVIRKEVSQEALTGSMGWSRARGRCWGRWGWRGGRSRCRGSGRGSRGRCWFGLVAFGSTRAGQECKEAGNAGGQGRVSRRGTRFVCGSGRAPRTSERLEEGCYRFGTRFGLGSGGASTKLDKIFVDSEPTPQCSQGAGEVHV
jgi:hypothetical protein